MIDPYMPADFYEYESSFWDDLDVLAEQAYDEAMAEQALQELAPAVASIQYDRFSDDERHLLNTFARSLNFTVAAQELGTTPKALRSKLERLKTRQMVTLAGS
jgi:hypothetical protein